MWLLDAEDFDPDAGFQQPSVVGDKWDGEDEDDVKVIYI